MTTFILGAIVGLCAWLLFFAVRWLQPRFWPPARRQERYRIRLRKTREELRQARKAEEASVAAYLSMGERRAAWAMGSPGGSCLKEGKTVVIPPQSPAGPLTTASPTTVSLSDAEQAIIVATIPPSSPSALPGTPNGPAGRA